MKKLFTFMAAILMAGAAAAQVPNEMNYSVMVLNPKTGRVMQNKEVQLRLELRQGSASGQAVWAQDFTETTDQSGLCLLTLNLADNIDWGKGDYYMAMLVDGEETGAPKLTSVPYALCAAKAQTLEGVITKEELVGTWVYTREEDGSLYYDSYKNRQFSEDGKIIYGHSLTLTFPYSLTRDGGCIYWFEDYISGVDNERKCNWRTLKIIKLSSTQILMGDNFSEMYLFTKIQ